ncbi:MAG TPA: sigma-70 family RNA polymerase sigma factor [Pirellulales bacterium]
MAIWDEIAVESEAPTGIRGEDLLARMAAGDRPAFALFYDLYAPRVLGNLLRGLRHRADAEDVLQETFHHVWRAAGQYSPDRSSPEVWLMLIARSRLIDFVRRRRPHATGSLSAASAAPVDLMAGLAHDEAAARMKQALAKLPAEQQSAISLSYFGGLTHREVARQQNIPLGTAKTRILLGIRSLRKLLDADGKRNGA